VLPLVSVPPGASVWPSSSKNIQKIVNLTTLLGPPAKSQLCGAVHSAYHKQPTGGCTNEEVALMKRIHLASAVAALMAVMAASSAFAQGPLTRAGLPVRRTALLLTTIKGLALLLSEAALAITYGQPNSEDPS
jgi:hypothetical protein